LREMGEDAVVQRSIPFTNGYSHGRKKQGLINRLAIERFIK
jgi:hypothetical protein